MFAPASVSGLAMKKLAGRPAAAAFVRNVALPMNPFCRLEPSDRHPAADKQAKANGFGFWMARNERLFAFVQLPPRYRLGSADSALFTPLKYARKIGSGEVPGAPVYAKVVPRPAAMFAWRFACAFLN